MFIQSMSEGFQISTVTTYDTKIMNRIQRGLEDLRFIDIQKRCMNKIEFTLNIEFSS